MEEVDFGAADPKRAVWNSTLSWLLRQGEESAPGGEGPGTTASPSSTTVQVSVTVFV